MRDKKGKSPGRIYRFLISLASLVVPRGQRADWKQEWNAELIYRWSLLNKWRTLNMKSRFDLFNRCRGAFRDAGLLQLHQLREGFFKDVQYGCRLLIKHRGFTVVSVLTLALAIGANTAIFSVVYHLILNPLNIKNGNRAVYVWRANPKQRGMMIAPTADIVEKWRQDAKSFDAIEPYTSDAINIVGQGEPESLAAYLIAPTMFDILTEMPRLGRPFTGEDAKPGAQPVVIISDNVWKSHFGADRAVLGRQLTTTDKSYTIVGVMSSKFQLDGRHPDLWLPLPKEPETNTSALSFRSSGPALRSVVAILKKDVSPDKAKAELDVLSVQAERPDAPFKGWTTSLVTPLDYLGSDVAQALYILFAAVGFVLLIACANVANLMLARNTVRAKEVAIRTALGAARIRLVRQLLTETLLLAAVGGILGVMIGYAGLNVIITYGKTQIPQLAQVSMNAVALGFAFGISLLTGLLCGFLPSLNASKANLNDILKEAGQSASAGIRHNRIRNLLTIAEIALSLVLLVAAG